MTKVDSVANWVNQASPNHLDVKDKLGNLCGHLVNFLKTIPSKIRENPSILGKVLVISFLATLILCELTRFIIKNNEDPDENFEDSNEVLSSTKTKKVPVEKIYE